MCICVCMFVCVCVCVCMFVCMCVCVCVGSHSSISCRSSYHQLPHQQQQQQQQQKVEDQLKGYIKKQSMLLREPKFNRKRCIFRNNYEP